MSPRSSIPCAAFLIALLGGCTQSNPAVELRDGDAVMFETDVQPVIAGSCAFLGCHGREGMPLTLYAHDYLRMRDPEGDIDPRRPTLDERALSPGELEHNRRAFAARIRAAAPELDRERFARRLVPEAQGGISHAGVTVFERADDPRLEAIRRFLETVE